MKLASQNKLQSSSTDSIAVCPASSWASNASLRALGSSFALFFSRIQSIICLFVLSLKSVHKQYDCFSHTICSNLHLPLIIEVDSHWPACFTFVPCTPLSSQRLDGCFNMKLRLYDSSFQDPLKAFILLLKGQKHPTAYIVYPHPSMSPILSSQLHVPVMLTVQLCPSHSRHTWPRGLFTWPSHGFLCRSQIVIPVLKLRAKETCLCHHQCLT